MHSHNDDTGSGRRLGRAQSAISQTVATLEDVQGVSLFDRSGFRPVLTDIGRILVEQARSVLSGAAQFEALAAGMRAGIGPELGVAIDPLVPTAAFIDSLHALRAEFPHLPVSFSTEGLGGAERRLRRGDAALALCILIPGVPEDLFALPLSRVNLVPAVSSRHPLARLGRPATRTELSGHVQLVLTDPSAPDGPSYGIVGRHSWRFVELGRRLDFLLAGLGWCRMPEPLVAPALGDGRLVHLAIEDDPATGSGPLTIYAAHLRDRPLGRAGSWLFRTLQAGFAAPPAAGWRPRPSRDDDRATRWRRSPVARGGGEHSGCGEGDRCRRRSAGLPRPTVPRVAAPRVLAPVPVPVPGRFLATCPDIRLEVVVDDVPVDGVAGGPDAGIRLTGAVRRDMAAG